MNAVYRLLEIGVEEGLLLYTRKTSDGAYGEWLMITPALTITKKEVDELITLLKKTIKRFEIELQKKGFLLEARYKNLKD